MSRFLDGRSLGIAVLIFMASSVVGLVYNAAYPKGIPLIRKKVEVGDTLSAGPNISKPDTQLVSKVLSLSEAYEYYSSGEAVFVDARSRADYERERIAGAISLPESDFAEAYLSASQFLTPEAHLVVYCQGRECDESMIVQEMLVEMGYTRVDVFLGGIPEWLEAGHPVERGPAAKEK
jgi:rhodanese-related sulfurtransferase